MLAKYVYFAREKIQPERTIKPMNNGGLYDPLVALNAARRNKMERDEARGNATEVSVKITYKKVLEWVQNKISESEQYNRVLQECMNDDSPKGTEQLKGIIYQLLRTYPTPLDNRNIEDFQTRIYEDMCGMSILTSWLDDPDVEEINVYGPGPKQIEIITSSRGAFMLEDGFPDAESVLNIAKRMVREGNMVIDQSNPRVDSYMGNGTRVSVMIPPIVRGDKGAVISIRKQTKSRITKDALIRHKTAIPEELELIELLTENKISGAVIGETGAGKTTLLNYVMSEYVKNAQEQTRVYIIEESRELQLPEDARVIYTAVYGDEKAGTLIDAPALLKSALRFHPTFISCAEMRGEEAMNAMNAAQTGHVVWSTFHAENCEKAYQRLLTMCKMSGTDLSENLMMRNLVDAFPIIVSVHQLRDGTRKITGIYEAEGVNGTEVIGHYIYRIQIERYEYDEAGRVKHIYGAHRRVGHLSDKMAQKIYDSCGKLSAVQKFAAPGWKPEFVSNSLSEQVPAEYCF